MKSLRVEYIRTGLLILACSFNGCDNNDKPHKSQLIKATLTAEIDGKKGFSKEEWNELCDGLDIDRNSKVFYKEYGLPKASRKAYIKYLNENNGY